MAEEMIISLARRLPIYNKSTGEKSLPASGL